MKFISTKLWLFLQTIPTFFLILIYWACVGDSSRERFLPYLALTSLVYSIWIIVVEKKKEIFDELAKETLLQVDNIILKLVYCINTIIAFLIPLTNYNFYTYYIGYLILLELFFLTLLRVVIFSYLNKKGLE